METVFSHYSLFATEDVVDIEHVLIDDDDRDELGTRLAGSRGATPEDRRFGHDVPSPFDATKTYANNMPCSVASTRDTARKDRRERMRIRALMSRACRGGAHSM